MSAFRLNGWQRGGIAAAVAIGVAVILAYLDYRSFEAEARSYLGITFEDTKNVVGYRLGYPDTVLVPDESGEGHSSRVFFTDPDSQIAAMPQDRHVDDYSWWVSIPRVNARR